MASNILLQQPDVTEIDDEEFQSIRTLVHRHFGINLSDAKRNLVVGRLRKVLRERGFASFKQYYEFVREDQSGEALEELANRISTNHTFFYRESDHFDFFVHEAVPQLQARAARDGERKLRIWCAGCSSGEEPFGLMMKLMHVRGPEFRQWDIRILATDLSVQALQRAVAGVYGPDKLQYMPPDVRAKFMRRLPDGQYQVLDFVKRHVVFRQHNLMNKRYPFRQPFDAVFCRNVMIYFDRQTREDLVDRFHAHTHPGGYLFIGHSETLCRDRCPYEYLQPAVYRKRPA
jgi:chemotaxis protein methyltransferase CheR